MTDSRLTIALEAAVPLQYAELGLPGSFAQFVPELGKMADLISTKGDVMLFGGGKKGEAAAAFNAVARGIAILSALPGGVELFGWKWINGQPQKT